MNKLEQIDHILGSFQSAYGDYEESIGKARGLIAEMKAEEGAMPKEQLFACLKALTPKADDKMIRDFIDEYLKMRNDTQ